MPEMFGCGDIGDSRGQLLQQQCGESQQENPWELRGDLSGLRQQQQCGKSQQENTGELRGRRGRVTAAAAVWGESAGEHQGAQRAILLQVLGLTLAATLALVSSLRISLTL